KTFATDYLKQKNIDIIDADKIARNILSSGTEGLLQVTQAFGPAILDSRGQLNRQKLRRLAFANEQALERLNTITHPLIRQTLLSDLKRANQYPYVVLSAPLLFENHLQEYCEAVVVIDIPETLQLIRGMNRDNQARADIANIIAKQLSRQQRLRLANYVIDNSGEVKSTQAQLDKLHRHLVMLNR
ncbi:MAG: dephospho-CoA kinase, partial [Cardiobacteriales bacterium]